MKRVAYWIFSASAFATPTLTLISLVAPPARANLVKTPGIWSDASSTCYCDDPQNTCKCAS